MNENGMIQSYLNYFGCLLLGTFIAEKYFPTAGKKDSFFHTFLISSTTTYAGALLGSYIYNFTYPDLDSNSNSDDSDSDSGE